MSNLEHELLQLDADIGPALENVLLPAALVDKHGVIRWQNTAGAARIGQNVGSPFAAFVAPSDRVVLRDFIARILASGEPAEATLHLLTVEGEYEPREVEASAVPVRGGGAIVAIFGISHNSAPRQSAATRQVDTDLTGRQLEILRLLADGRSTREIASQLYLSETTVRNHVTNLIAALGVHSRLQAVLKAQKSGLLVA